MGNNNFSQFSVYFQMFIRTLNANPIKLAVAKVVMLDPLFSPSAPASASWADTMKTTVAKNSTKRSCFIILSWNIKRMHKRTTVGIICHNNELSSSLRWLDCLQTDSEVFVLSAEINQILLKNSFIPTLLIFMCLVALYQ